MILKLIGWTFIALLLAGCSKNVDKTIRSVTVKTFNISTLDFSSVTAGGQITDPGDLPLQEKGICYNTSTGPTISNSIVVSTNSSDSFTCTLTKLKPGTKYYVRAYAKNNSGIFYGNEVSFQIDVPVGMVDYDASFTPFLGTPYAYHVKQLLYYYNGHNYDWATYNYARTDTFYHVEGQIDSAFGLNKGCVALVSNIDPSQQPLYSYFIGSYYKFSFFNDTTVGNLQFMVPTDSFPSIDSIPVTGVPGAGGLPAGYSLNFAGGLNSFYKSMAKSEVKVAPHKDFVQTGDNSSYANPAISAMGNIDSSRVTLFIKRFSDNGIHPNSNIIKTIDGHLILDFYFHDGSRFSLINCDFYNIPFQKAPM